MKNKFSKLLSITLTIIMVMSLIQIPVSASMQFKYTEPDRTYNASQPHYKAPIVGHPLHYAFTAWDPDDPTKEYAYTGITNTSLGGDATYFSGFQLSNDGILTVVPGFNNITARVFPAYEVKIANMNNSGETLNGTRNFWFMHPSADLDFEDGVTASGLDGGSIATDHETENKYYTSVSGNITFSTTYFLTAHSTNLAKFSVPVILEFSSDSILDGGLSFGNSAIFTPSTLTIPSGWNDYKVVVYTYGEHRGKLDVYMNDNLVISKQVHANHNTDGFVLAATNIDNVKCYATSLGFAYNISSVMSVEGSSRTINVNASHAQIPTSNIPEELEYAFFECDSAGVLLSDTPLTAPSSEPLYRINESTDIGKNILAAARVRETIHDHCASEWAFADEYITVHEVVTEPLLVGTKGTSEANARFMLPSSVNGATKIWSVLADSDYDGVSITPEGVIEIEENPSSEVIIMSYDQSTYEINNYLLSFDTASESTGTPLAHALSSVMFKADVSTSSAATIFAGSYDFEVTSDADGFKFIVEEGQYNLFIDDVLVDSGVFDEEISDISVSNGTLSNYYAGSPLKTPGLFTSATIVEGYEYCEISAPVTVFYNESGIYPDPETYSYEWYFDGDSEPSFTDPSFVIPSGSEGKLLYCVIKCENDSEEVSITTNVIEVGAQYGLTVDSSGSANLHLYAEDDDIYVVFAGDSDVIFRDMDGISDITVSLNPEKTYNVLILRKDTLAPRGLGSIVVPSEESVTPITLEGSSAVVNFIVKNTGVVENPAVPNHFEQPVTYEELKSYLYDYSFIANRFVGDVFIDTEAVSSYDNHDALTYGLYRIISVPVEGTVIENAPMVYNKLYKLFESLSNYSYGNFEAIATDALGLEFVCLNCGEFYNSAKDICTACNKTNTVIEEYDMIMDFASGVANRSNLNSLMGEEGKFFPAAATLERLSERSAKSDGMLSFLEIQLEKEGLPTDAVKLLAITSQYADAMAHLNRSSGLETALSDLTDYIILSEVKNSTNTTNVRFALDYLGSVAYDTASSKAKASVAGIVKGRTYVDIAALTLAVEDALDDYEDPKPDVNDENESSRPSSNRVSITGPAVPPPVVAPTSIFNDMATTHWAYPYVQTMNKAGVLSGYNGNFRPEDAITRAEFAKVLCTAFGINAQADAGFTDVADNAWYANYVNALASSGIAKGDGVSFRPNDVITRQDAVVLLERALTFIGVGLEKGETSFVDNAQISDYAKEAIASLVKAGVINGLNDGSFAPASNITRAQVAKIICVATKLGGDK